MGRDVEYEEDFLIPKSRPKVKSHSRGVVIEIRAPTLRVLIVSLSRVSIVVPSSPFLFTRRSLQSEIDGHSQVLVIRIMFVKRKVN